MSLYYPGMPMMGVGGGPIMPSMPAGMGPYYGVGPQYNATSFFPALSMPMASPMMMPMGGMPMAPSLAPPPQPLLPPPSSPPPKEETHKNEDGDFFDRINPFKSDDKKEDVTPTQPPTKETTPMASIPQNPTPNLPPQGAACMPCLPPVPPSTGFNINIMAPGTNVIVQPSGPVMASPGAATVIPPYAYGANYCCPSGDPKTLNALPAGGTAPSAVALPAAQPFYPNTPLAALPAPASTEAAAPNASPEELKTLRQLLSMDPQLGPMVKDLSDADLAQMLNDPQIGPLVQQLGTLAPAAKPPTGTAGVTPSVPPSPAMPPLATAIGKAPEDKDPDVKTLRKMLKMDPQTAPMADLIPEAELKTMLKDPQVAGAVKQIGPMIANMDDATLASMMAAGGVAGATPPAPTANITSPEAMASELSKTMTPEQARQLLSDPTVQSMAYQYDVPPASKPAVETPAAPKAS